MNIWILATALSAFAMGFVAGYFVSLNKVGSDIDELTQQIEENGRRIMENDRRIEENERRIEALKS